VPKPSHGLHVNATIQLDNSGHAALSRKILRAAGFESGQKLKVSATPGRIVLESESRSVCGKVKKRGNLKIWTGPVPNIPLEVAIDRIRHFER
jgi:hypothetical protein